MMAGARRELDRAGQAVDRHRLRPPGAGQPQHSQLQPEDCILRVGAHQFHLRLHMENHKVEGWCLNKKCG